MKIDCAHVGSRACLVALAVATLALAACSASNSLESKREPAQPPMPPPANGTKMVPEISVQILGPVASLVGHPWPHGYDWSYKKPNQPFGMATEDRPHRLTIKLPSGRTITHISKLTSFSQIHGTIVDADLLPHPG